MTQVEDITSVPLMQSPHHHSSSTSTITRVHDRKLACLEKMMLVCQLPFSILDHPDFREFIRELDQTFLLPSSTAFLGLLRSKSQAVERALRSKLDSSVSVVLGMDYWSSTSANSRSYLQIVAHFLNNEWLHEQRVIAFEKFDFENEKPSDILQYLRSKWGATWNVTCFTYNNGSAFWKSAHSNVSGSYENKKSVKNQACLEDSKSSILSSIVPMNNMELLVPNYAWELMNIVQKSLEGAGPLINDMMESAKRVEEYLNSSRGQFMSVGRERLLGGNDPLEINIPWINTVRTGRRLLTLWESVDITLRNNGQSHLLLGPIHRSTISEFVDIMSPFEEAVAQKLEEPGSCVSVCIPTLIALKTHLRMINAEHLTQLVESLLTNVEDKFRSFSDNPFYILATLLHPKWKTGPFQVLGTQQMAIQILNDEVSKIKNRVRISSSTHNNNNNNDIDVKPCIVSHSSTKKSRLDHMFEDLNMVQGKQSATPEDEVKKYITEDLGESDYSRYWRKKESDFPCLAILAKKHLALKANPCPFQWYRRCSDVIWRDAQGPMDAGTLSAMTVVNWNVDVL